jgi:hypothetical protein
MDFHDADHSFDCPCCGFGWNAADRAVDADGYTISPAVCQTCYGHRDVLDKQLVYKMHYEHAEIARGRYHAVINERSETVVHNRELRSELTAKQRDQTGRSTRLTWRRCSTSG